MKKLILLASLVASNVLAQSYSPPTYFSASVAFGSVTNAYTQFIAGGKSYVKMDVLNNTDKTILCTFDDGVTEVKLPAYSSYDPEVGENKRYIVGAVKCKHAGVAPTVGTVDLFGYN